MTTETHTVSTSAVPIHSVLFQTSNLTPLNIQQQVLQAQPPPAVLNPAVEERLRQIIREEFALFERNLITLVRTELSNAFTVISQTVLPKVVLKDEKLPLINMKEHVDPLLGDLLHENKYPTIEEISEKLSLLTQKHDITPQQYKDWFDEKKSEVQDRMRHIRAYLGQKIREMFCEMYNVDLDMSTDIMKKQALLLPDHLYKNQTDVWTNVLLKACKPKEITINTRAWAEVIIDAFLNNKTLRDLGENAVIRAYKEKLGQPVSSGSSGTSSPPKKQKKRRKPSKEKLEKKSETDDMESDEASPPTPSTPIITTTSNINMPIAHMMTSGNILHNQVYSQTNSQYVVQPQNYSIIHSVPMPQTPVEEDIKRGRKRKGEDNES